MVLAHDDVGSGSPAVLLVHAFPLDRRMWRRQVDALVGSNRRVITADLQGFGASPGSRASVDEHADDLAELLAARRVEKAVVCGLSMGGYVALAFARRHGSKLAALLLADTKAGPDNDEAKKGRDANIERAHREGVPAVFDAMRAKVFTTTSAHEHIEELRALAAAQSPSGVASALAMMRDRPDATRDLETIQAPTTIVVGSEDAATPPSEAQIMARAIQGAKLVTIEGAGHFTNIERPDEFNRAHLELVATACP
jgi:3-oxoadipate enol-lactonase